MEVEQACSSPSPEVRRTSRRHVIRVRAEVCSELGRDIYLAVQSVDNDPVRGSSDVQLL